MTDERDELDKAHRLLNQHFGWLRDLEITKVKQAQEIERLEKLIAFGVDTRIALAQEKDAEIAQLKKKLNAAITLLRRYDELYPDEFEISPRDESRSK